MYTFVFLNGVAMIQNEEGAIVISQPFKPVNAGNAPWTSAAEAEEWFKENYPEYFYHLRPAEEPELAPEEGPIVPSPAETGE